MTDIPKTNRPTFLDANCVHCGVSIPVMKLSPKDNTCPDCVMSRQVKNRKATQEDYDLMYTL